MIAFNANSIQQHTHSLVGIRRHLHQFPELSGSEYKTTQFLAAELSKEKISFRMGPDNRGLVVDFGNPNAERRLAIRADIDAIPVQDVKRVTYRSRVNSVMHACGHDAHSSILLGVVKALNEVFLSNDTDHAIRAIFQPEEETALGACRMIDFGVLDGVTAIIAAHVDPTRPVGTLGIRSGILTAHCNEIAVDFAGCGGHAARPHETADPIEMATQFISECYQAVPRYSKTNDRVVLSFTAIHGGENSNVIPDFVKLIGTMRSLDEKLREQSIAAIHETARRLSEHWRGKINVDFGLVVPSVVADPTLTEFIRNVGRNVLGEENVNEIPSPSMGGEDFAFYSQRLPASFIRLGCRGDDIGSLPLHNSGFDIDERVLSVGVQVMANAAIDFLNQSAK